MNIRSDIKYWPKINETYGNLKVISDPYEFRVNSGKHNKIWKVKCECLCEKHTIVEVDKNKLCRGDVRTCGCSYQKHHVKKDEKYNQLTVLSEFRIPMVSSSGKEFERRMVKCLCDCGNEHSVDIATLVTGHIQSCGGSKHTEYKTKIGEKYGEFEVIGEEFPIERTFKSGKVIRWMIPCKCSCDHDHNVIRHELVTGIVTHCKRTFHNKPKYDVKIGDNNFCLAAISEPYQKLLYKGKNEYMGFVVKCKCEPGCENITEVKVSDFVLGKVKSCGCWKTSS